MAPDGIEQRNVSLVGYHDVDGRPGFKIALQRTDERWYLYLAGFWHSGWSILDVTDPADPSFVRFVPGPENTFTLQVQIADGTMITSLEQPRARSPVDGTNYDPSAPYEEGAYIWDVESDPTTPRLLGQYKTGGEGTHRNYYTGGEYAFMAAVPDDFDGRMLEIVDISDPADPVTVGQWWWPGQRSDEPGGDETYYFHGPAYVAGDRAYLSYGRVGMVVLDVTDVTDPTLVSRLNFGDMGSWLGTHSAIPIPETDLAVVNSEAILEGAPTDRARGEPLNYTFIVDIAADQSVGFSGQQATGPRIISFLPLPTPEDHLPYSNYYEKPGRFGPHNQHHHRGSDLRYKTEDYLFMTYFNAGLRVFDVSDPLAPREVGHFVPADPETRVGSSRPGSGLVSTFEDVVVDTRGYIYCTDPHHGLFVLESSFLP